MSRVRSHFFTFAILLLFASLLVVLDQGNRMDAPQNVGQRFSLPAEVGLSSLADGVGNVVDTVRHLGEIKGENETLRKQIEQLTLVNVQLIELQEENKRLRELLGFQEQHPNYTLQMAEITARDAPAAVIGQEVSNLVQAVRINQGLEAGVEPGMSVITARGLVGRVLEAGTGWAKVLLLTDETSKVTAIIQQGRATGVVQGNGDGLVMRYIPHEERVEPGDVVLSAGLGDLFTEEGPVGVPKGLVIGVIESVEHSDTNPWQEAVVRSAIDFTQLDYLFIVRNFEAPPAEAEQ